MRGLKNNQESNKRSTVPISACLQEADHEILKAEHKQQKADHEDLESGYRIDIAKLMKLYDQLTVPPPPPGVH